ncbi:MAG: hypothetical protein AAGD47_12655 [Pseudomonadota bacterium]
MTAIVIAGAIVTLVGLALLAWSGFAAWRIRQTPDLDEAAAKSRIQRMIAINMGGVALGFLGLGVVMVGLFLR